MVYRKRQKIFEVIEQLLVENPTFDDIFKLLASQNQIKSSKNGGFKL